MKLLLDTHLLLWVAEGSKRMPAGTRTLIENRDNVLVFSVASLWEIAIKSGLNRQSFEVNARALRRGLIDSGFQELPILSEHAVAIDDLPPIHKDPFDRILISQARVEGITLLTNDRIVSKYGRPVRMI
ncbi:MAG: type II toxin-antitoxin system VapC family toxin [Hyphomicrobiales bacterium]|nr:type II toxin-antitoxin system VapC family toxin [Hyphomicrobiales bacterium]MBV9516502.1 type II toxin-antitoxin system VapC family toxin [Hyphomicrobiales bacterium]